MRVAWQWLVCAGCLLASACSAPLSTLQPARIVPAGHVQLSLATDATVPRRALGDSVQELADSKKPSNRVEATELLQQAASTLVQPPSANLRGQVAVGLSKRFELHAGASLSSAKGGIRWQFLRKRPGLYGVLGVAAHATFRAPPLERATDAVQLSRYRRADVEVPLSFGYSNRWIHLWGGPKLVWSGLRAGLQSCAERGDDCVADVSARLTGAALYSAGQVGVALGYRRFWVALEFTAAHMLLDATVDVSAEGERERANVRRQGPVLAPAVGLLLWI